MFNHVIHHHFMQFGGEFSIFRWLPSSNLNLAMENPSFIDDVPTVSMSAKHIHLATEKNTMGHSGRKKKGTQAMYLPGQKQRRTTYDSAALIFAKAKRCTLTWKSGPKQRRLPRKVTCKKCKDLKWTLFVLCHIFFGELSNFQSLVRLVLWKQGSNRQKKHPCIYLCRGASCGCFSLSSKLVKELQPEKALYKI